MVTVSVSDDFTAIRKPVAVSKRVLQTYSWQQWIVVKGFGVWGPWNLLAVFPLVS